MMYDLLSVLIAIVLTCSAVLDLGMLEAHRGIVALCGLALVVLGLCAYRSDYLKWPGVTGVIAGIAILLLIVSGLAANSSEWMFWVVFWSANTAGVLLLWSLLYRGPKDAIPESS